MRRLAATLALASLVLPGAARAAPGELTDVVFRQMRADSQEAQIVAVKLPEVTGIKGATISTALLPLDMSATASVIVRVVSPRTCDVSGKRCRTVALKANATDWNVIFDRRTQTMELGAPGFGAVRRILVDHGYESWDWNGHAYHMDLPAVGQPIAAKEIRSASQAAAIVQQFGPGAKRMFDRRARLRLTAAALDLRGKGTKDQLFARLDGPGVCGITLGCPWRVLVPEGQGYRTLLSGFGTEKVVMMPVARGDGWRDLAAEIPKGYSVYGWTGKGYALSEIVPDQGAFQ